MPISNNISSQENNFSIIENNQTRPLRASEYYVAYSATRLVFISSLSSTLALGLVPVGMGLVTYCTASILHKASKHGQYLALPSPFQFELCIRILGGGLMSLYRYLCYLSRSTKSSRISSVPALKQCAWILVGFFSLSLSITIVDGLFHIKTSTVQYTRITPSVDSNFTPGRQLFANCTDQSGYACNINPGGSGANTRLSGVQEAYQILGNVSQKSSISLADDGITAVIVPVGVPPNSGFTAQSFGSATTCEAIAGRCDPHYTGGLSDASSLWGYDCKEANAGVQISGNFTKADGVITGISTNSMTTSMVWYFFNDSAKTMKISNDLGNAFNGQIWTALQFYLPSAEINRTKIITDPSGQLTYYDPVRDLVGDTRGNVFGLLSCNTTLSNITYKAATNGSITLVDSSLMTETMSKPFYQAFAWGFGYDNLKSGLGVAGVSSTSGAQLAYEFARSVDRTILGLTGGYLAEEGALDMYTVSSRQVAKIPVPEFVALIALNAVMSMSGIIFALIALWLRRKQEVVDVQTRLDIGALVAALFENSRLDQTAKNLGDMYAELRGQQTARIVATDGNNKGGRVFVAVQPDREMSNT